jgi:hypothetical protein
VCFHQQPKEGLERKVEVSKFNSIVKKATSKLVASIVSHKPIQATKTAVQTLGRSN